MKVAVEAAVKTGRVCEAAICYTGDILDPARSKYSCNIMCALAKELEKMGAHTLAIKDMAGLLRPYAAVQLVKALREEIGLPIHLHTHDTSGINAATILKASEAGVHVADARHFFHERHDQPAESQFDCCRAGAHRARYRPRTSKP